MTITLYDFIQSELIKKGLNEFIDEEGNLIFFEQKYQFTSKILSFDDDVAKIVHDLFCGQSLNNKEYDHHFKKAFLYRFVNRKINRQTIEAFQMEMLSTFLSNESFINRIYNDVDKYVTQTSLSHQTNNQVNKQKNEGNTTSDNRSAFADLPQNNVQLDVDSTVMESASDNTISRNKQTNKQETDGESSGETIGENKSYQLDELFKTNGLLDQIFNVFDVKCFMQVW